MPRRRIQWKRWVLRLLATHADELQFDLATITSKLSELDEEQEIPQIKLGDASCAAPFTSKLSNVSASEWIEIPCLPKLKMFSHKYHSARTMYACRYYPNVQDSRP